MGLRLTGDRMSWTFCVVSFFKGCRLGFARARTLMDDAVVAMVDGAPTKGVGDLKALRPTLMGKCAVHGFGVKDRYTVWCGTTTNDNGWHLT